MSWSSRFGSWGGRFSPFGRNASESSSQVTDSDFSYITSEDLARFQSESGYAREPQQAHSQVSSPLSPSGADDILILKHRRVSYPLHFPVGTIDSGEITMGVLRIAAARKLEVKDARKIKLFYKGRNLKDDKRLARDEGFRSGLEAEILCVVGEANVIAPDGIYVDDGEAVGGAESDDGSDSDDGAPAAADAPSDGKKKRRRKGKKKRSKAGTTASPAGASAGAVPPTSFEYLPTPGMAYPPRPTSAPPPVTQALPTDPLGQLDALNEKLQSTLKPMCEAFIRNPPADKAKRDFEHKKLTETLLQQILLKLDSVETAGVEGARERRKALVKDCQGWLSRLDEVVR